VTVTVRVECGALAVAASNALAFFPANSQIKQARMHLAGSSLCFTATDSYAAGRDYCTVNAVDGDAFAVLIDRAALIDLEKVARAGKKTEGDLTVTPGDGFRFKALDGSDDPPIAHFDLSAGNESVYELYDAIDDMLTPEQEFRVAFQPMLLQRFSKVKADKDERIADVCIDDPDSPVLVKIGQTFKGLIMPVSRSAHAELIGDEGLW
jgi:hypothetical protein